MRSLIIITLSVLTTTQTAFATGYSGVNGDLEVLYLIIIAIAALFYFLPKLVSSLRKLNAKRISGHINHFQDDSPLS